MSTALLLLKAHAEHLHNVAAAWGTLDLTVLDGEGLFGICGYSQGSDFSVRYRAVQEYAEHDLRLGREVRDCAMWYRGREDIPLRAFAADMRARDAAVSPGAFRDWIEQGWKHPPREGFLALVEDRSLAPHLWTAWWASTSQVVPVEVIRFDAASDPFVQLEGLWPRRYARDSHVAVFGVGSIGSVVAETLATYDVGTLTLVDDDRLEPRNLIRHRCGAKDLGRYKVDAMKERLRSLVGVRDVRPRRWNVITGANQVRGLLKDGVDLAVVCTDGVASRQAASHLTRWAGVNAVFACVLEDGAVGEIVRVPHRPGVGCLLCLRRSLRAADALDPEPGLDREYGTGTAHRPMTAVGGDLELVGTLAAKAAIATLLESAGGFWRHRLPGDHMVIGLQPAGDLLAPFDVPTALSLSAHALPPPHPSCIACAASPLHRPS